MYCPAGDRKRGQPTLHSSFVHQSRKNSIKLASFCLIAYVNLLISWGLFDLCYGNVPGKHGDTMFTFVQKPSVCPGFPYMCDFILNITVFFKYERINKIKLKLSQCAISVLVGDARPRTVAGEMRATVGRRRQ